MPFMFPQRLAVLTAVSLLALGIAPHANAASSPQGIWIDNTGRGAVEIKPCGNALCGHVVWVKSTSDTRGCGRQIIGDAAPSGSNAHEGWIYSPEDRKRYNVEISPMKDGRLKVVGYAGMRLFSKTMYWTPASPDLVRCDAVQAKAEPKEPAPATVPAAKPPAETAALQAPRANASQPTAMAPAPQAAPSRGATEPPAAGAKPAVTPPPASTQAHVPEEPAGPTASENDASTDDSAANAEMAEKPSLKKLAKVLDKVITRSRNGDCNLDLPWLQVRFRCDEE